MHNWTSVIVHCELFFLSEGGGDDADGLEREGFGEEFADVVD